jgi:hypothetical protein
MIALAIIGYSLVGLVVARAWAVRCMKDGSWARAYDNVERFMPIIATLLFWPVALGVFFIAMPPRPERKAKLEAKIKELEKELGL